VKEKERNDEVVPFLGEIVQPENPVTEDMKIVQTGNAPIFEPKREAEKRKEAAGRKGHADGYGA
jgi:hypothetical protein